MKNPYTAARIAVAKGMTYVEAMRWYTEGIRTKRKNAREIVKRETKRGGPRHEQVRRSGLPRSTFYRHLAVLMEQQ